VPQWKELGLNVTLPQNVSLDVGFNDSARRLSEGYTRTLVSHVIYWSQGPTTLGLETMIFKWIQVEKGKESLQSCVEEKSSGDSRRPSWRARSSTTTS